ncbi:hypothetical protein WJX82_000052 [Trebouxia sp. C0006]
MCPQKDVPRNDSPIVFRHRAGCKAEHYLVFSTLVLTPGPLGELERSLHSHQSTGKGQPQFANIHSSDILLGDIIELAVIHTEPFAAILLVYKHNWAGPRTVGRHYDPSRKHLQHFFSLRLSLRRSIHRLECNHRDGGDWHRRPRLPWQADAISPSSS